MPITGAPNSTAIVTYRGVALSMGDCFVKVSPGELADTIEVEGQFVAIDSEDSFSGVTGAVRNTAEGYLLQVVAAVGGICRTQEVDGPQGRRIIVAGNFVQDASPARDLINPFSGRTFSGVYLTGVAHQDQGGNYFTVTWTFLKPHTAEGDGTLDTTLTWTSVANGSLPIKIGNRGGKLDMDANGAQYTLKATAQYTKSKTTEAAPLTYIKDLLTSLKLERFATSEAPRGAAGAKLAIKTYSPNSLGSLTWGDNGTFTQVILESATYSSQTPGIFDINLTFIGSR